MHHLRTHTTGIAATVVLLLGASACASSPTDGSASAGSTVAGTGPTAVAEQAGTSGTEPDTDVLTPMIVSSLGDPVPVRGTDDRYHVAYELAVLNATPRTMTITGVETVADGSVVATVSADEVQERTVIVGALPLEPPPVKTVAPGQTGVLILDDVYDSRDAVPDRFSHRIAATFAPPDPGLHPFASQYPDEIVQDTGAVSLGTGEPITIGAPLRGEGWLAANACCTVSSHRSAMLPLSGRINASERYAIDWVQLSPAAMASPAEVPDGMMPTFDGDPADNASYEAFDEPLLAVADATVAAIVDGGPDQPPQALPEGLGLHDLGGNYAVLDLGDGFYAFYAHVSPGTFTVAVGDRVHKGDVIGSLGNSGNTSEPHLHFHVSRGPTPLASTNWPYQFDELTVEGTIGEGMAIQPTPTPGERTSVLPLALNVIDFPA